MSNKLKNFLQDCKDRGIKVSRTGSIGISDLYFYRLELPEGVVKHVIVDDRNESFFTIYAKVPGMRTVDMVRNLEVLGHD